MSEPFAPSRVRKRFVQSRLGEAGLHFDLIQDDWPPVEDEEIFNANHSLTYRFTPRSLGRGSYEREAGPEDYVLMGSVVLIPAFTPLRLRGAGGSMIHGRLEFAPGLFPELDAILNSMSRKALGRCMDITCPEVTHTLHRLISEARNPDWASPSVLTDLGHLLSLDVLRFLSRDKDSVTTASDPLITFRQAVEQHMLSLATLKTSATEISAALDLSPRQFSRKFRHYFGHSFNEYLQKQRINSAANLLAQTDQSLKVIAHTCGYTDHAAFSRHFLAATRLSPSAYRKMFCHHLH